jgi:Na+-transporting NADH:ubiquinone oxidoreductase subunit NqrC
MLALNFNACNLHILTKECINNLHTRTYIRFVLCCLFADVQAAAALKLSKAQRKNLKRADKKKKILQSTGEACGKRKKERGLQSTAKLVPIINLLL